MTTASIPAPVPETPCAPVTLPVAGAKVPVRLPATPWLPVAAPVTGARVPGQFAFGPNLAGHGARDIPQGSACSSGDAMSAGHISGQVSKGSG